jgi:hypothetical protein
MAKRKEETAVTAWLKENEAEDYIDAFYEQGYYGIEAVDDEAIQEIVKDKPGIAKTLKNALSERKKRESVQAMAPPRLPAGTVLDLSAPELKTEDGIRFSVAKSLSVDSTKAAIVSPNNIKPEEWSIIARSANLLYAYDMDSDEPKWAKTPILDWKVPRRDDFARSEISHAKVTSVLTYSDETASYVASGFDTQTATAAYAFCAASFERNRKFKSARSSEKKTFIQVGMWKYPRAQIYLDKCTIPSKRFKAAIRKALRADDSFGELHKVFKEYGHVVPSSVLLGGQLCYKESSTSDSFADEQSEEVKIKAAVEGKVAKVSASAGMAYGSATDEQKSSVKLEEFTSFTNQGGDSLLCTNPPEWAPTVKDPANWAVIEMGGMRPTVDLLDDKLRKRVLDVFWNNREAMLGLMEIDDWEEGEGALYPNNDKLKAVMMENSGFVAAVRLCGDGPRGSVVLVSAGPSPEENRQEGGPGVASGAAYAHMYTRGDTWYECNSICLPVPQGGSFRTMFQSTSGKPDARLTFTPSTLSFGQWQSVEVDQDGMTSQAKEDGFLFVTIHARAGERGGVKGLLNGKEIAGSYVHTYYQDDERIEQQSFCTPVPQGTTFRIVFDFSSGAPEVHAYWMPLYDERWRMREASPVPVNTQIVAGTDGILHGWIKPTEDRDRGTLKVYTGDDAVSDNPEQLPCVAASMHWYSPHDRWVKYSSVMLPIARETPYKAVFRPSSGNPQAQVYWTALVARKEG